MHATLRVCTHNLPSGLPPESERFKIWEAARATSAAPLYFDAALVDGKKYWDGALTHNNPILQVWDEKLLQHGNDPVSCVDSLGTGNPLHRSQSNDNPEGNLQIAKDTIKMITDTESKHKEFETKARHEKVKYHRLNPVIGVEDIGLADFAKLDLVERYTREYLQRPEIEQIIKDCAARLVSPAEIIKDYGISSSSPVRRSLTKRVVRRLIPRRARKQ